MMSVTLSRRRAILIGAALILTPAPAQGDLMQGLIKGLKGEETTPAAPPADSAAPAPANHTASTPSLGSFGNEFRGQYTYLIAPAAGNSNN